jgi:hypothetical protein
LVHYTEHLMGCKFMAFISVADAVFAMKPTHPAAQITAIAKFYIDLSRSIAMEVR